MRNGRFGDALGASPSRPDARPTAESFRTLSGSATPPLPFSNNQPARLQSSSRTLFVTPRFCQPGFPTLLNAFNNAENQQLPKFGPSNLRLTLYFTAT